LPPGIIDTGKVNYEGHRVRLHEDMLSRLYNAMDTLEKEGIDLQLVDTFRYYDVQEESYKNSKGTSKEGKVARPEESYHVKGIAFDLAQTVPSMQDPRVAEVLENAGFIRSRDDEWYHWSMPDEEAFLKGLVSIEQYDKQAEYR